MRANNSRHRPQKFRLFEERNLVGVFQNQLEAVKASIKNFSFILTTNITRKSIKNLKETKSENNFAVVSFL